MSRRPSAIDRRLPSPGRWTPNGQESEGTLYGIVAEIALEAEKPFGPFGSFSQYWK